MPCGEDALGYVAQRQVGDHQVVSRGYLIPPQPVVTNNPRDAERRVGVRKHGTLGRTGGPRRVDQRHHVVRPGIGHVAHHYVGVLGPVLPTDGQEVVPVHEPVVGVGPHATGLAVDDPGEVRDHGRVDLQDTVDLFLVLGKVDGGPAVGQEIFDLGCGIGRVKADRDAAYRNRGEVQDDPLGPVLGLDGDTVADLYAQCQQAVSGIQDQLPGACPGVLLPDAEVLLPHGDAGRVAGSPVAGEARNGDGRSRYMRRRTLLDCQCHVPPCSQFPPIDRRKLGDPISIVNP